MLSSYAMLSYARVCCVGSAVQWQWPKYNFDLIANRRITHLLLSLLRKSLWARSEYNEWLSKSSLAECKADTARHPYNFWWCLDDTKIYEIEIRPSFLFHSFLLEVKVLNTNSETQIEISESLDDSEGINANSEHFRSLKWLLAKQKKSHWWFHWEWWK